VQILKENISIGSQKIPNMKIYYNMMKFNV